MNSMIIEVDSIHKHFFGVKALNGVSFNLRKGELHALVGENGAGKSTLIKTISGVHKPDSGTIKIGTEHVSFNNPGEAKRYGLGVIYQEFNLVPELSVAENIFLGNELFFGPMKQIKKNETIQKALNVLKDLNLKMDPEEKIISLGVGQQQMVEICKALVADPKILIMDEPTAALTKGEIRELFNVIKKLKSSGVSIIYISHRLEEIFEIADRITILRDGKTIETYAMENVSRDEIVRKMTGRKFESFFPKVKVKISTNEKILEVMKISSSKVLENSFYLRRGEILGFYGMMGSGRTELMRALFGADRSSYEYILIDGENQRIRKPSDAVNAGLGFLTEDRKSQGLFLDLSILHNFSIASIWKYGKSFKIDLNSEKIDLCKFKGNFNIKMHSLNHAVKNLSGGNQQKVLLSKWINTDPKILILDEPTRGIDVGAKSELYELLFDLVNNGISVILVSSELPEVVALSNRVLVMKEGRIVKELSDDDVTQEKILNEAV